MGSEMCIRDSHSSVTTPEHWDYDPDYVFVRCDKMDQYKYAAPKAFDRTDGALEAALAASRAHAEFFAALEAAEDVADAARSVCRLRFLLLQKG